MADWCKNLLSSADAWEDDLWIRMASEAKGRQYRSLESLLLFEIVKQHRLHSEALPEKRKIDFCNMAYDQRHYTDARACWCDYLVTKDTDLASIARDIRGHVADSPEPISFEDLVEQVRSDAWLQQ